MNNMVPGAPDGPLALSLFTLLLTFGATLAIGLVLAVFPLLGRLAVWLKEKSRDRHARQTGRGPAEVIPLEHVAAISAAVAAMIGQHRIVRIEPAQHHHYGNGWQSEGRAAHHGSHTVFHPGAPQRQLDNEGHRHHGTEIQNHSRRARI